jgi:hypothetical protein
MEIVRVRAVRVCVILSVDDNTVLYVYSICYVWGEGGGARPDELCLDGVGLLAVAGWWVCLLNPMLIMTQNSKTHNIFIPSFCMAGGWSQLMLSLEYTMS